MSNLSVRIDEGVDLKALATTFGFQTFSVSNNPVSARISIAGKTAQQIAEFRDVAQNSKNVISPLAITLFLQKPSNVPVNEWVEQHFYMEKKTD